MGKHAKALRDARRLFEAAERAFSIYQTTKDALGCEPDLMRALRDARDRAQVRMGYAESRYVNAAVVGVR